MNLKLVSLTMAIAFMGTNFAVTPVSAQKIQYLNHFKCYDIVDSTPSKPQKLKLADQFLSSVGLLGRPRMLCNPVSKNGEPIQNKEYHLVCYELKADEKPQKREVATYSQLDKLKIVTGEPRIMCLPVEKKHL